LDFFVDFVLERRLRRVLRSLARALVLEMLRSVRLPPLDFLCFA
jgi:hypothetical protein